MSGVFIICGCSLGIHLEVEECSDLALHDHSPLCTSVHKGESWVKLDLDCFK